MNNNAAAASVNLYREEKNVFLYQLYSAIMDGKRVGELPWGCNFIYDREYTMRKKSWDDAMKDAHNKLQGRTYKMPYTDSPLLFTIGSGQWFAEATERVEKFSKNKNAILVTGGTGTGKSTIARAVYFFMVGIRETLSSTNVRMVAALSLTPSCSVMNEGRSPAPRQPKRVFSKKQTAEYFLWIMLQIYHRQPKQCSSGHSITEPFEESAV